MTSLEALEAYSDAHSETFEELLEWPYRRFNKAFAAWQKRKQIDDIDVRKNLHVSALYTITEWKDEGDQREAIESVENYYDLLKDIVWDPSKADRENKEMQEMEKNDPFLAAGKRNLQKVIPIKFPNQDEIENSLN